MISRVYKLSVESVSSPYRMHRPSRARDRSRPFVYIYVRLLTAHALKLNVRPKVKRLGCRSTAGA